MKNLITHMRRSRINRPREARMWIDTKLIDTELAAYDQMLVDFNTMENRLRAAEGQLSIRESELATAKNVIEERGFVEKGLRADLKGMTEEVARLRKEMEVLVSKPVEKSN